MSSDQKKLTKRAPHKKYMKPAQTPAVQPRRKSKKSVEKTRSPSPEEAIFDYLAAHYEVGYEQETGTLYVISTQGHCIAVRITDSGLHEAIAYALYEGDIDITPQDVKVWFEKNSFKLKHQARHIQVSQRVKGSPHQGKVTIDIGDDDGTFVTVTPEHCVIAPTDHRDPDIIMVRPKHQAALPLPAKKASDEAVDKLMALLNLVETEIYLFIAWLTYCLTHELNTNVMRLFLVLTGQQGSGKTSFCQHIIQRFLDPNMIGVQRMPDKIDDVIISSQQCYVPIYDNVSQVSKSLSNDLCQMATGSAIVKRKLFTNTGSVVSQMQRTVVFNGIEQPFVHSDMISRCLYLHFQPLSPQQRRSETELVAYLDIHAADIMRGLLDLCVDIMKEWPTATPTHTDRAVDFSRWLAAFDKVLGLPEEEGSFSLETAYVANLSHVYLSALGNHPLAYALYQIALAQEGDVWTGSPNDLFQLVSEFAAEGTAWRHSRQLPANPIALGRQLDGQVALLSKVGVHLERHRGTQRTITLWCDSFCPGVRE